MRFVIKAEDQYWDGEGWTDRQSEAEKYEEYRDAAGELYDGVVGNPDDAARIVTLRPRETEVEYALVREKDGLYLSYIELLDNFDPTFDFSGNEVDAVLFDDEQRAYAIRDFLEAFTNDGFYVTEVPE